MDIYTLFHYLVSYSFKDFVCSFRNGVLSNDVLKKLYEDKNKKKYLQFSVGVEWVKW
jgi:hypothetical protein